MAIFTPRGMKIRLQVDYAFALMARLFPETDAFRILQKTEEVENLHVTAAYISAITVFLLQLDPTMVCTVVATTSIAFKIIHMLGLFIPPVTFLLSVSRVYSFLCGRGFLLAPLLVLGWLTVGFRGFVAYFVGRLLGFFIGEGIGLCWSNVVFNKTGACITGSERSFFHAYRLLANKQGVPLSVEVDDDELEESNWLPVYDHLEINWPVMTARFTND